jgi:streptogramin lyase
MSETRYFGGNSYVNALQAPDDVIAKGAYLQPSQSNAAVICQWMQKIAGTYKSSMFTSNIQMSNSLSYSSADTSGGYYGSLLQQEGTVWIWAGNTALCKLFNSKNGTATSYSAPGTGSSGMIAGCLLPDNRALSIPSNRATPYVTIWNNTTKTATSISTLRFGIAGQTSGACQLPDGRICISPGNAVNGIANVIIFDQNTSLFSNAFAFSGAGGCTLDVTGNVVFVPSTETAGIMVWNPTTNERSKLSISGMADSFVGSAIVPDGRIVFGPWTQNYIGVYNPFTYSYTSYPITISAGVNFGAAKTLPDGTVLFLPFNATFFGIFNPYTNTYSTFTTNGISTFYGGTVIPDGRIVLANTGATLGIPILEGFNASVPIEWCLHPFFNRFR